MTATFGTCELSLDRIELRRDGAPVAIEPQVFDVLTYLLTHRDRVVSKQELLDEVWGTRFVSESALTSRIKSARRAVGDNGQSADPSARHSLRAVAKETAAAAADAAMAVIVDALDGLDAVPEARAS